MQLLFPKSTTQTLSELKHQLNWNNVILTCTLIIYISTTLSEEERDFFFLKNSRVPLDILTVLGEEKQNRKKKNHVHMYVGPTRLRVKSLSQTMCRAYMRVRFSPMKHRCPHQLRPPLSPWDDDGDSDWWLCPALLPPPSILPIPCSCAPLLSGLTHSPWLLMQSSAHH